ncbi:Transcription repressor OFP12 [Spatholobus suberectus]|nr:Transcription repressor OFP12 [Spatholobus suberectus]
MQPFTPESPPASPTATSSSVDHNHNRPSSPATSSIPINNVNRDHHAATLQNPFPFLEPEPAVLATAFASQRFFFSSPGRSNSIVESTNTDADCTTTSSSSPATAVGDEPAAVDEKAKAKAVFCGSVAVETYSPDPYADFRRSMEEMVEARPELMDVKSNWHVLHELLLCYLALNPKSTHNFILAAFADLLVGFISSPPQNPGPGDVAGAGDGCSN